MPPPDALLFDFSDSEWHFGFDGAVRMANAYPDTPLLLYHWGCRCPGLRAVQWRPAGVIRRGGESSPDSCPCPGEPFTLSRLMDA